MCTTLVVCWLVAAAWEEELFHLVKRHETACSLGGAGLARKHVYLYSTSSTHSLDRAASHGSSGAMSTACDWPLPGRRALAIIASEIRTS